VEYHPIQPIAIEQIKTNEYTPRFTKIEDQVVRDPITEYILAKPKNNQVKDIAHQIVKLVGDMYPISDQEIRLYVERILNCLTAEQLQDILTRKYSYSEKIKAKIRSLADVYAENQFKDFITIGRIATQAKWKFSEMIVPGKLGPSISNSLYEREGEMNNFEISVITDIASLPNIVFWHRNLGRGKGFAINGYKSNHYPDFIVVTKSGKILILETKGDDRDNSDSAAKCRLGNKWAELAGKDFKYFMIFDRSLIEGAFTLEKAKELIRLIK
jgi:type III restriction enzyme